MTHHPESDQLSALLDGALTGHELVTLEAHLAGCADCRDVLDALRATMTDLRSLWDEPVDETTMWAIRAAVAREARLSGRGRRFAWAAGGAAAAVVAILTFALAGGGGDSANTAATKAGREALALDAMQILTDNFDDQTLSGALKDVTGLRRLAIKNATGAGSGGGAFSAAPPEPASEDAAAPSHATSAPTVRTTSSGTTEARGTAADPDLDRVRTCLDSIRSERQPSTVIEVIAARYKKEPVFLYFLEAPAARPTRIELWVTTRKECTVRYFQQTRIPPS